MNDVAPLTVISDANILIHGKPLRDLPWSELGRPAIEVLIVAPVIKELDKLKTQAGRPNRIARQLVADIRALIDVPGQRRVLRKFGPAVTMRVDLRSFDELLDATLARDHADHVLINYAMNVRQNGADVLFLTDDTICGATARSVGLATHLLPDHWRREPEPDGTQKEIARLKAEVLRLRDAEPSVKLGFRDLAGSPLERLQASVTRWPPLSEAELDDLMETVRLRCPQATSFGRPQPGVPQQMNELWAAVERLSHGLYEPATKGEIERYQTVDYPNWLSSVRNALASLHLTLGERTAWPTIVAIGTNVGTRPAVDALLRIRCRGAIAIWNYESEDGGPTPDTLALPLPPAPPRSRAKLIGHLAGTAPLAFDRPSIHDLLPLDAPRRDSDVFYWRKGRRNWVSLMELECVSWRHDQSEVSVALKVRQTGTDHASGAIELSIHANNLSDVVIERLPVQISFENEPTLDEARALVAMLGESPRPHARRWIATTDPAAPRRGTDQGG